MKTRNCYQETGHHCCGHSANLSGNLFSSKYILQISIQVGLWPLCTKNVHEKCLHIPEIAVDIYLFHDHINHIGVECVPMIEQYESDWCEISF